MIRHTDLYPLGEEMRLQVLECAIGGHRWTREPQRGRAPRVCPEHVHGANLTDRPPPDHSDYSDIEDVTLPGMEGYTPVQREGPAIQRAAQLAEKMQATISRTPYLIVRLSEPEIQLVKRLLNDSSDPVADGILRQL